MSDFKFGDKVLYLDEIWLVVAFDQKNNIVDLIRKCDLSIRGVLMPRGANGIVTLISRHQEWIKIDWDDESTLPSKSMCVLVNISNSIQHMFYDVETGDFDRNMYGVNKFITHWSHYLSLQRS